MFKIVNLKHFITLFSVLLIAIIVFGICHIGGTVVSTNSDQTDIQPTVYLTFDDGPSAVTDDLLDTLATEQIKATFFVIGSTTEHGIGLYNRIIDDGHALGLHTFSHNTPYIYESPEVFMQDFNKLSDWIFDNTNTSPNIFRFPGGSHTIECSDKVMKDIKESILDEGYRIYDWDIPANDSSNFTLSAKDIYENVVRLAEKKNGQDLVILFHDDALRTTLPTAISDIINYFKSEGYNFGVLDENTVLK